MAASGNQGLQAADILVFMELVSHHNGYKLCDSGKQQVRMECFLILGLTSSDTETVFEMVDGFFHIHTYFVGGVPFLRTPESAGISPKILFRINIEHPAAGGIRAGIFTMAGTPAFSGLLIVFPFYFRAYSFGFYADSGKNGSSTREYENWVEKGCTCCQLV